MIETTAEHPFYVEHKGFVPAGLLAIGNSIVTRAGPSLAINGIEKKDTPQRVYNFTVEEFHSYFVGNSKLWVHNLDCEDLRPGATEEARRWLNVVGERPAVAASMGVEVNGVKRTFVGASSKNNPDWFVHHDVENLYNNVPLAERANPAFHGQCAEVHILSQMFAAGINPTGANLKSLAINIDAEDLKRHGTGRSACRSCRYVIRNMLGGVDLVGNKLNGKYLGGP